MYSVCMFAFVYCGVCVLWLLMCVVASLCCVCVGLLLSVLHWFCVHVIRCGWLVGCVWSCCLLCLVCFVCVGVLLLWCDVCWCCVCFVLFCCVWVCVVVFRGAFGVCGV